MDDDPVDRASAMDESIDKAAPTLVAPSGRPGLSRRARVGVAVGCVVVALAVCLGIVFGYVLPRHDADRRLDAAKQGFTAAASAYADVQQKLTQDVATAQQLAAAVAPADVADPGTLTTLASAVTAAQAAIAPAPAMASDPGTIDAQTADLKTKQASAQAAGQGLVAAAQAVQHSRVALATQALQTQLDAAQGVYDGSSGLVDDESLRDTLAAQLDSAKQALTATPAPSDDPGDAIAGWNQAGSALKAASDAVSADQQKVADATYTYLLTEPQITCGFALCSDGFIASVKVTVHAGAVTAQVCGSQQPIVSVQDCIGADGTQGWWRWSGKRDGATAIIRPDQYADEFSWATITFAGAAPQAAAVSFVSPDDCERQDGTHGTEDITACR